MKKLFVVFGIITTNVLSAQVLEVPTLESKGIMAQASTVEVNQYDFVKDKGLTITQTDVETYDEKGRLAVLDRKVHSTGLSYKYTYKLSRKGFLGEEKIINAANNETVRTTTYDYKKGLLVSTTQVQGTVTFVKNYSYNKNGHLIKMVAKENGTSKGEEIYQVDEKGRRTRNSQKLPTEEVARTISTFSYTTEGNLETKTEIRNVNEGKYEIVVTKDIEKGRNLKETTKNLSDSKSSFNNFLFVNDQKGSWTKGEIIDNQFGRSRLILKKITYTDGAIAGRIERTPEDDLARYYRQNDKFQVIINGKIATTGSAMDVFDSKDRLAFNALHNAWVLMKGYDTESYQTTWHEGQIITNTKDAVIWVHNSKGIEMYQNGKKLKSSTLSANGEYSESIVANTRLIYFGGDIKGSMVVRGIDKTTDLGNVEVAEFTKKHNYWAKSSDTTYVTVGYGKSLTISGQAQDGSGNNLITVRVGDGSYFYLLPKFREGFDNGKPGDVFPAIYLQEPLKELSEEGVYDADFSSFKHDNFKKSQYNLKTVDGQKVSGLALPTQKTKNNELITYFPLTKQYLKMDGYYAASDDEDLLDQPVSVLLDGFSDGYYVYNEGANIGFYQQGVAASKYRFSSYNLEENKKQYGAVLYDSVRNVTYGMNYDLTLGDVMGPMKKLPIIQYNVYLLKLDNGKWIVFNRGGKIANYDYATIDGINAILFFKDNNGKVGAYRFEGSAEAKTGDFIASHYVTGQEAIQLSERLKVDPFKPIVKDKKP